MSYKVKRILEPDYGCEERPADYIPMDKVVLEDINGNEIIKEVADVELYEKDINEGDAVIFDENIIKKV
ncbi:MAG: hypothetical protein K6F30_07445 [Lachnospiraceae bacterium]|nr:hypothetical protein [Lachnospiraceae bacterium]